MSAQPSLPVAKVTVRSRLPQWLTGQVMGVSLLSLLLIWLVLVPIALIIWGSFRDSPPGAAGGYTLVNYVNAFEGSLLKTIANSLVFALGATAVAFVIGGFLAWVTERTNTPLRWIIYSLTLFPLIVPNVLMSSAWMLVLNPKIGVLNKMAQLWLGMDGPLINGYSMGAMIWVEGIDHITLPFLMMAAAFRSMDPSLEEAAMAAGASIGKTLRSVTLPLMLPSILAIILLIFVRAIESFDVAAVIGIPAGIPVFATQVWLAVEAANSDYNIAATYGVGYLIVTLLCLWAYHRATKASERYVTVTGKAFRPRRIDMGAWRWPISIFSTILLLATIGLPILLFIWTSLLPYYQVPSIAALEVISLDNYVSLFKNPATVTAFVNTIIVGLFASVAAVLLAAIISWTVIRSKVPGRHFLDFLATAPIAVPGSVMGLALLWLYLTVPIPIYGTLWILVVGFVGKYITIALRASHASLSQIGKELEEASEASGASWGRSFAKVTLPLMSPGLVVGYIYVLSLCFKVLSMPILLGHTRTRLIAPWIYHLYADGQYPQLCAMGVMLLVVVMTLGFMGKVIGSRFGVREE